MGSPPSFTALTYTAHHITLIRPLNLT